MSAVAASQQFDHGVVNQRRSIARESPGSKNTALPPHLRKVMSTLVVKPASVSLVMLSE